MLLFIKYSLFVKHITYFFQLWYSWRFSDSKRANGERKWNWQKRKKIETNDLVRAKTRWGICTSATLKIFFCTISKSLKDQLTWLFRMIMIPALDKDWTTLSKTWDEVSPTRFWFCDSRLDAATCSFERKKDWLYYQRMNQSNEYLLQLYGTEIGASIEGYLFVLLQKSIH